MEYLSRREFLSVVAGTPSFAAATLTAPAVPIIDAHIHLFDPTRPGGVPWPPKDDPVLYRPALPQRYENIARPLGVVGAIAIEASPWLEDNQWLLDVANRNRIIVGTIGNLEPGMREFGKQLDRFQKNKLFRGIRYGNLWGRKLGLRLHDPAFVADLKLLAQANLVLDTANPDVALIRAIVRLSDKIPELRVVIDHLPHLEPPSNPSLQRQLEADLAELGKRRQVYVKVSEVLRRTEGRIVSDPNFYRDTLDRLWATFGGSRLIYGSDWPNSDPWGTYGEVLNVVRVYFSTKGHEATENYFWRNSAAAYRWIKRDPAQPAT